MGLGVEGSGFGVHGKSSPQMVVYIEHDLKPADFGGEFQFGHRLVCLEAVLLTACICLADVVLCSVDYGGSQPSMGDRKINLKKWNIDCQRSVYTQQ